MELPGSAGGAAGRRRLGSAQHGARPLHARGRPRLLELERGKPSLSSSRHCERSEAISCRGWRLLRHAGARLAMTPALSLLIYPPSTICLQPQPAVAPCENREEPSMQQERRKEGRSPAYL